MLLEIQLGLLLSPNPFFGLRYVTAKTLTGVCKFSCDSYIVTVFFVKVHRKLGLLFKNIDCKKDNVKTILFNKGQQSIFPSWPYLYK